jgi:hypothetical protein
MDAKQCPWCSRWCLKDEACNYIFACGLISTGEFKIGSGCGRSWCWHCGKKFCSKHYDEILGIKISKRIHHDKNCCRSEKDFKESDYCCGGHNSHCEKRW